MANMVKKLVEKILIEGIEVNEFSKEGETVRYLSVYGKKIGRDGKPEVRQEIYTASQTMEESLRGCVGKVASFDTELQVTAQRIKALVV